MEQHHEVLVATVFNRYIANPIAALLGFHVEHDVLPARVADYGAEQIDRLCMSGRVAWAQASGPGVDEPGMGIEFLQVDDETRALVGRMVEKLSQDLARAPAVPLRRSFNVVNGPAWAGSRSQR